MKIAQTLSVFVVRQLICGVGEIVGVKAGAEVAANLIIPRITDQSQRLVQTLQESNQRAWTALEIALAGDSLWDKCKALLARGEDRAFAQQVRMFLDANPLPELTGKD